MARQKLSEEERRRRQRAGIKRWHRRVDSQVEELFAEFHSENGQKTPDPSEFTQAYYDRYGEYLPLIYARAHTDFGEQYGSDINWEDAGCGEFRPRKHFNNAADAALDKHIEEMEALYEAHIASLTPEQRATVESPTDHEVKLKVDDDFDSDSDLPF